MKKSILLLAMLPMWALADDVKITTPSLVVKNDTLTLTCQMDFSVVRAGNFQTYAFTPMLFAGEGEQCTLPPVVITDKKKFKMRKADRKLAAKGNYSMPYTVMRGMPSQRENSVVNYTLQMPYKPWMEQMKMRIYEEKKEVCIINLPTPEYIKPEPQLPQAGQICEPCMQMVSYLTPKEEPIKVRNEQNTLYIQYPVGSSAFDLNIGKNASEFEKLKRTLTPLTQGDLVTFKSVAVCGYASPDGSVKTNERLSAERAQSFAEHLGQTFDFTDSLLHVSSAGEDWDGLISILNAQKPDYAQQALAIIDGQPDLDKREAQLKKEMGENYTRMLNDYFPLLRRINISVDFEVREVRNAEAAQLIYTNPKLLSLQEMYGVAKNYEPGTKEYKQVYEIAATCYPEDVVANINAASANIISGDFERAQQFMDRVKDDPRAYNNLGVLAWLNGDADKAVEWFTKALQEEPEKAQHNLEYIQ